MSSKQREALVAVKKLFDGHIMFQPAIRACHKQVNEALAEPRLNCEVGTVQEQSERFRDYCEAHKDKYAECLYCPLVGETGGHCELAWAQMPYNETRRPMASETQLKRCPFCGREAKVGEYNHGKWFVECRNPWCFASFNGHTFVSKQTAIAAWNRRVSNGTNEIKRPRECDRFADEKQADALHAAFIEHCNRCDCPMGCDHRKNPRFLLDGNCASIMKCFARFALSKATPKEGGAK